jgi:hypothetical protein
MHREALDIGKIGFAQKPQWSRSYQIPGVDQFGNF